MIEGRAGAEAGRFLVGVDRAVLTAAIFGIAAFAFAAKAELASPVTWTAPADKRLDRLENRLKRLEGRSGRGFGPGP